MSRIGLVQYSTADMPATAIQRVRTFIVLTFVTLTLATVRAEPTMSVTSYGYVSPNVDPLRPGDELRTTYSVENTTTNIGDANNLILFVVPAGTNHGVYGAVSMRDHWTATLGADETTFYCNGDPIRLHDDGVFAIRSTCLTLGRANSRALAEGEFGAIPFSNEVEVIVPREQPSEPVISGIAVEAITNMLAVTNLGAGWDYAVLTTTNLMADFWQTADTFRAMGPGTNWSANQEVNGVFYRIQFLPVTIP